MKKIFTILLLALLANPGIAQVLPAWVNFSGPSNFANFDVKEVSTAVDSIGNFYTAASMLDTINTLNKSILIKYNSAGVQQWRKLYDDPGANNGSYVVSLLVDKAGNSYVCGYGRHNGTSNLDFMVIKYNTVGTKLWIQYSDGGQNQDDYATCATFDHSGNIIVGGYVNYFGITSDDIGVTKWDTSGTKLWSYVYNNAASNSEDRAIAIASDTNNSIFITGSTYVVNGRNMITLKVNSSGVGQWVKIIPHVNSSTDEKGASIVADNAGNCYATGTPGDWTTIKYNASGMVLWTNHYTTNVLNSFSSQKIMVDKFNNVIVTGDASVGSGNFSDLIVDKINSVNGVSIWSINFNNGGVDLFADAVLDTNANIYVSGRFEGTLSTDMSLMKVSPTGTVVWNTTYSNSLNSIGVDLPYNMTIDKYNDIVLAGVAETRGSNSIDAVDVITLKFSPSITGVNEITTSPDFLCVYPNPAKENSVITIVKKNNEANVVRITNLIGESVLEQKMNDINTSLNLPALYPGIYFITINNGSNSETKKLIIE